ncbi:hypothetical protein NL418_010215 [Escherichia coli]|nr:hypothetical protein [Escherichia coli]WCQ55362.1 hypothetical protein NL418_010215 [Escherichia coli]
MKKFWVGDYWGVFFWGEKKKGKFKKKKNKNPKPFEGGENPKWGYHYTVTLISFIE